ncbi:hypothetical protein M8J77_003076 [Diaphorina citri]|nr:hypothetical protein M8J77_003076 [Diaphorina citri]
MVIHFMNFANHLSNNLHDVTTTHAIRTVYAYCSYLAIVPLNINTLSLSWKATLLCFIMYLTDGYFATNYMRGQFQFQQNKMLAFLVPKAFRTVETFLQMVMYTTILHTHLFYNSQLKFILRRITHVDARMSLVHGMRSSDLDVNLPRKIHSFFIFFSIFSFLAMAFRHLTISPYSATAIFGFFLPHFQPYAITAQFITFLDIITNRFDAINSYIKSLKLLHYEKTLNMTIVKGELTTLACVHNDLCNLCLLVNKYFNVQILLTVACHFLSISVAAYTFLSSLGMFFQNETMSNTQMILLVLHTVLWICQRFVILILTAQASIRAQTSARDTHQISHKLLIKEHVPGLCQELELFTSNVEKHQVEFSACGFFPIDYSMIYMIIGAATTYWVILVQIQSSAFTPQSPQANSNATTPKPTLSSLVNTIVNVTTMLNAIPTNKTGVMG